MAAAAADSADVHADGAREQGASMAAAAADCADVYVDGAHEQGPEKGSRKKRAKFTHHKANDEILKAQASRSPCIPRKHFERVVNAMVKDINEEIHPWTTRGEQKPVRVGKDALSALQSVSEDRLIKYHIKCMLRVL